MEINKLSIIDLAIKWLQRDVTNSDVQEWSQVNKFTSVKKITEGSTETKIYVGDHPEKLQELEFELVDKGVFTQDEWDKFYYLLNTPNN